MGGGGRRGGRPSRAARCEAAPSLPVTVWWSTARNSDGPRLLAGPAGRQKNAARRRRFQKSRRVALSVLYETDLFHARVLGVRQHPGQHTVIGVRVGVYLQHRLVDGKKKKQESKYVGVEGM